MAGRGGATDRPAKGTAPTAPGRVIRLYTQEDFARRPHHDTPEIRRRELSQLCLDLRAMEVGGIEWLDEPPEAALSAAEELLERL